MVGMRMPGAPCSQVGLDGDHYQYSHHSYQTRQGPVTLAEEIWQTWVVEGHEGSRKEVHEGGSDEHAGPKVLGVEDNLILAPALGLARDQGETAGCPDRPEKSAGARDMLHSQTEGKWAGGKRTSSAQGQYQDQRKDMEGRVIGALLAAPTLGFRVFILPLRQLGEEEMVRYRGQRGICHWETEVSVSISVESSKGHMVTNLWQAPCCVRAGALKTGFTLFAAYPI